MSFKQCKVICDLKRSETPLISTVPTDEFTDTVQNNFDYEFNGESAFYPFEMPNEIKEMEFSILAIVGASGSGKSTFLKQFPFYNKPREEFDSTKAIVSNFENPTIASQKLSAVGLNSMPVWCRPRKVLSVGEGFRADLALNLNSDTIFDEFTSTVDRNVAKSTCNSIQKYIRENNLKNLVFCSCHSDHIPFLQPDFVIDLDEEKIYDCRDYDLGKQLNYKSTKPQEKIDGIFLGNIII